MQLPRVLILFSLEGIIVMISVNFNKLSLIKHLPGFIIFALLNIKV